MQVGCGLDVADVEVVWAKVVPGCGSSRNVRTDHKRFIHALNKD